MRIRYAMASLFAMAAFEAGADVYLKPLDIPDLLRKDALLAKDQVPKYAVPHAVADHFVDRGSQAGGSWVQLHDGYWQWQTLVHADGASSIDLGFTRYWLPHGARLDLMDPVEERIWHSYTDVDNERGQVWTPVFRGTSVRVRLTVPENLRDHVNLELGQANYGYRFFNEEAVAKAASCNVDAVCPAGDAVRDQIRAVAVITNGGSGGFCSGSLINNVRSDGTPYFLTAEHCSVNGTTANFYFNYQSDVCRTGADSGIALPLMGDVVAGARLVAENPESDFTLLLLDEAPPAEFNVYFAGWDRRDIPPAMATGIHHPAGDEKRLAVEMDPLVDSVVPVSFGRPSFGPNTYWEVLEWDIGITEQGSSGSPLLNQDLRIVGQLGGGALFNCPGAEEGSDIYGKLSASFDLGVTDETSLAPWLDPDATAIQTLDGTDGCTPPQVSVSGPTSIVAAGEDVLVMSSVTSDQGPFEFAWDVDGDGEIDARTQDISVRYPSAGTRNVRLTVTDSTGCSGTTGLGLVVDGPMLDVASVAAPVEVCGDGDMNVEPGESWSYQVNLTNRGGTAFADGLVAFRPGSAAALPTDGFGYSTTSSSDSPACAFSPITLSGDALVLTPVDAGGSPSSDDGGAVVALGGNGFSLYGMSVTEVLVSTNGYIALDPSQDSGTDFGNLCPYPREPAQGGGARIAAFHDDLVLNGRIIHEYFPTCPRAPDSGEPGQGCNVIQWENVSFFNDSSRVFSMQTVLYEDSLEIVHTYLDGDNLNGGGASIALQNADYSTGLNFSCNEPNAPPQSAVCFFHPDSPAPRDASEQIVLDRSAIEVNALPAGASGNIGITVSFPESMECGTSFAVDYLGSATPAAYASGQMSVLSGALDSSQCQVTSADCGAAVQEVSPMEGFWLNPLRPGNGMDLHVRQGLYGTWYTARADRSPVWYYLQTLSGQEYTGNQVSAEILEFRGPVDNPATPVSFETVGNVAFSFAGNRRALMTWDLNGEPFGEYLTFFDLNASPTVDPAITDQWFNPTESGWGFGVHRQGADEFTAAYLYDTGDRPVWAVILDSGALAAGQSTPLGIFESQCPGCGWLPPVFQVAGAMDVSYLPDDTAELNFSLNSSAPGPEVQWERQSFELRSIKSVIGQ